jgi:AraC-like DNA-binding protein
MLEESVEKIKNVQSWKDFILEKDVRLSHFATELPATLPGAFARKRVHFLFCLQQNVTLRFGPNYARELPQGHHFLVFNPDASISFELVASAQSVLVWLSLSLEYLHELFVHEPLPFLKPENINRAYYEEKTTTTPIQIVLRQLLKTQLGENAQLLFARAKMLELLSLYFSHKSPDTETCPFLKDEAVMRKIKAAKDHLLQHLDNPPTIRELSRICGLNEYQLKTGFKEVYGSTIYGYLLDHKLDYARLLLDKGTLHVNEVAFQVGYSNPSHFIAAFKKKFGITPKKYLLSLRSGK